MSILSWLWRNRTNLASVVASSRPTFSQFGEDLAIFNLLRPTHQGTYLDVGANDPFSGSNTAALYVRGWSGLVVEPNPAFADAFRRRRPRDRLVTAGVADVDRTLTYFEFANDKYNTFSAARAAQLASEGHPPLRERTIPCKPLHALIAEHLPGRRIDLLSVDCEGMDLAVLQSARLTELKPLALVVEDFGQYIGFREGRPGSHFDQYLRSQDYSPVYQCAWSSIYVHNDWRARQQAPAFHPPEELDNYMPRPRAECAEPTPDG